MKEGKEPLHSLKECSDVYNFDSDGLACNYSAIALHP